MTTIGSTTTITTDSNTLDRRVDGIGWALFLIMVGALMLLPAGWVPTGTWLVGVGSIMIGMNVVRHLKSLRVSGFTVVLGLVALALGVSAVAGIALPVFPLLLAAIGIEIVYGFIRQR
jgi:hypothetical protein